jgi:hypothetical protein
MHCRNDKNDITEWKTKPQGNMSVWLLIACLHLLSNIIDLIMDSSNVTLVHCTIIVPVCIVKLWVIFSIHNSVLKKLGQYIISLSGTVLHRSKLKSVTKHVGGVTFDVTVWFYIGLPRLYSMINQYCFFRQKSWLKMLVRYNLNEFTIDENYCKSSEQ